MKLAEHMEKWIDAEVLRGYRKVRMIPELQLR